MKLFASMLLALVVLFSLSGCGDNTGQSTTDPVNDSSQESTVESPISEPSLESYEPEEQTVKSEELVESISPSEAIQSQSTQEESAAVQDTASEAPQSQPPVDQEAPMENQRIKLSFDGNEVFVTLYDTPAGRELLSRLPLTLEFQDYAGEEKISYLDEELPTDTDSGAPSTGDFTYYAPWGNLAIFYNKTASAGNGLMVLGNLDSGRELLAEMTGSFTMVIELAD